MCRCFIVRCMGVVIVCWVFWYCERSGAGGFVAISLFCWSVYGMVWRFMGVLDVGCGFCMDWLCRLVGCV